MLVMTAKVDKKKIAIVLAGIVVVIAALVLLMGGGDATPTTNVTNVANNDDRVNFLTGFGWDVVTSPAESNQVRIPEKASEIFDRYNALQKSQGYDLSNYAGATVMRYVYKVNNFPGATEPVYATLLISKNRIIGGDITDTSARGAIRGFKMPQNNSIATTTPTVAPTTKPTT